MLTSVNTENEAQGYSSRFSDRDRDSQWLPVDRFVDKPIKPEDLVYDRPHARRRLDLLQVAGPDRPRSKE